ncbi:hypothetical protein Hanom_Chr11g00967921 [Helianthus anomalus]
MLTPHCRVHQPPVSRNNHKLKVSHKRTNTEIQVSEMVSSIRWTLLKMERLPVSILAEQRCFLQ